MYIYYIYIVHVYMYIHVCNYTCEFIYLQMGSAVAHSKKQASKL